MDILFKFKVLLLNLSAFARKDYIAKVCGHSTKQSGEQFSLGDNYILNMPLSENGDLDYCLDCVAKMSISCAWCGEPIHIGDPITLYTPKPDFEIPKHAVRYSEHENKLIGCTRLTCADLGAGDRQGFWIPPGKVHRTASPTEIILATGNKQVLLVNSLSNPNDLGKLI